MDLISIVLHSLNILLSTVLLYVYGQNYSKMKSRYTVGLIIFAGLFLVHSVMGLYFDASMVMYSDKTAEAVATFLEMLKAVSLVVLAKISWE